MHTYTDQETDVIILSSFDCLSYSVIRQLYDSFESNTPNFAKHKNFLIKTLSGGVYNKVKDKFYDDAYRRKCLDALDGAGIKCVTYFSENYPFNLKNTDDPPLLLYCIGNTDLLKTECFSIVGSRNTLAVAIADCKKYAEALSERYTIVSGIAEGADAAAVQSALDAGGKVICVLACGVDVAYPAANANLIRKVAQTGLLISEYPAGTRPKPYYFPVRNRIIAGLSTGLLVVSAGQKSGALITAGYAADYGREVFAFPYYQGTKSGEGCNALIKNGAGMAENILDIFHGMGLDFKPREKIPLSEEENAAYEIIRELGEAFLPEVAARLNMPPYRVIPLITSLVIKKRAVNLGGNRYAAT